MRKSGDTIATWKVDYIYKDEERKAELERFKNGISDINAEHSKANKLDSLDVKHMTSKKILEGNCSGGYAGERWTFDY